jgi:type I restriction enzyme S subunit
VGIPVLSAQNIRGGELTYDTERFTTEEEYRAFARRLTLQPDDLLLTIVGTIGRAAVMTDVRPLVFQRSVAVVRPTRGAVDPRFLFHATQTSDFQEQLRRSTNQSSQAGVYLGRLKKAVVPLPPLPEQRRIAEILDRADALRRKRQAALAVVNGIGTAVFVEMFGHPSAPDPQWPKAKLGEISQTTSGGTPDRAVAGYYGGAIPWVKSGELHNAVVSSTEEHLTDKGLVESSAKLMPPGTVLLAMYGATAGAVATLAVAAATNQAICCIQPGTALDRTYLVGALKLLAPSLLRQRVGGAQPNLSQELVRNLMIPLPPMELQRTFAARIAACSKLLAGHNAALTKLAVLFASLQQRAFRGEL